MKKLEKVFIILKRLSEIKRLDKFEQFIQSDKVRDFQIEAVRSWRRSTKDGIVNKDRFLEEMERNKKKSMDDTCNLYLNTFWSYYYYQLAKETKEHITLNVVDLCEENSLKIDGLESFVQSKKRLQSAEDYYYSAWANKELYFSSLYTTKIEKGAIEAFENAERHLDISYAISKLEITLEKINRWYVLGGDFPEVTTVPPKVKDNLTIELYSNLYLLSKYATEKKQNSKVAENLIERTKLLLEKEEIKLKNRTVAVIFFINYLSTIKVNNWTEHAHHLYKIAIHHDLLREGGGQIGFEDLTNIISSCTNFKGAELLNEMHELCDGYKTYKHQQLILTFSEMAALFLEKKWRVLSAFEEEYKQKPHLSVRFYYIPHIHTLLIKAAFEALFYESKDGEPKTSKDILERLKIYKEYIELEPVGLSIKAGLIKRNLEWIKTLEDFYKNICSQLFMVGCKQENKRALEEWFKKLDPSMLYYNWLLNLRKQINKKFFHGK